MIGVALSLVLMAGSATESISESILPDQKTFREEIRGNLEAKGEIKGIQELPISKLYFVEAEQGTYIISADGRFVFDGRLTDVWHRRRIATLTDARETERTPVSNIGFKPEEQLATFSVGNTDVPRSGIAFVDPSSEHTARFLNEVKDAEDMNWTVILLPMVGGNSAVDRSMRLWCATDRKQAKLDLIEGTSESFSSMRPDCNDQPILMAMMLTDVFRIQSLPHIVREDGLISHGYPEEFMKWFEQP